MLNLTLNLLLQKFFKAHFNWFYTGVRLGQTVLNMWPQNFEKKMPYLALDFLLKKSFFVEANFTNCNPFCDLVSNFFPFLSEFQNYAYYQLKKKIILREICKGTHCLPIGTLALILFLYKRNR